MPGLDTSIPLQAKAPEMANPLQMMLQVGQYKLQQQNSNRLQKDTDANEAVSQAIQASTGPDGKVNYANVNSLLKGDPRGGYNGQAMQGANLAQTGQQISNGTAQIGQQGAQLKLNQEQLAHVVQQTSAALANPNLSYTDVVSMAVQNGKAFGVPDNVIQQVVSNLPSDQAGLRKTLQAKLAALQAPGPQLGTMTPAPQVQDLGGSRTVTDFNPITNPGIIGQNFNKTLAPESAIGRLPTVNAAGQAGSVPISSTVPSSLLPPGMQGSQPQGGAGRYPGAQGGAQAGGFIPSQAPAGVNEAASVAGQGSGTQLVQDSQAASGSGARVYQLQSALKALDEAGTTGPGTASANNFKSFLLAQTPGDLGKYLPGIDPQKIASYDEANKYLTQYASAKASALGGGTDSKLATTLSANASTHISGLAAKDVVKANIGLERMSQAQMAAWNASGLPESQYRAWSAKFGASMDPRVFVADQLDPSHVKKLYSGMQPKEQQQFRTQYNWAVQNGYINGPQ